MSLPPFLNIMSILMVLVIRNNCILGVLSNYFSAQKGSSDQKYSNIHANKQTYRDREAWINT